MALWIIVCIIGIFTVVNIGVSILLIKKMKEIKEIFVDHKENIEVINGKVEYIKGILNLKDFSM